MYRHIIFIVASIALSAVAAPVGPSAPNPLSFSRIVDRNAEPSKLELVPNGDSERRAATLFDAPDAEVEARRVRPNDNEARRVLPNDKKARRVLPNDKEARRVLPNDKKARRVLPNDNEA